MGRRPKNSNPAGIGTKDGNQGSSQEVMQGKAKEIIGETITTQRQNVEVESSKGPQRNSEKMTPPGKDRMQQWSEIVSGGSSQNSWADKVEQDLSSNETDRGKDPYCKGKSIWDSFDISKIANAGFKLEYVNPEYYNNQKIGEIEMGDISFEIEH